MLRRFVPSLLACCVVAIFSAAAQAETSAPLWKVVTVANPTNLTPGDKTGAEALMVVATNVGGASTNGSAITVSDSLPVGLKAVGVLGVDSYKARTWGTPEEGRGNFEEGGHEMQCSLVPDPNCVTSEPVDPGDTLIVTVKVDVETSVEGSSEVNGASVSGGGAVGASASEPVTISSASPAYGIAKGGVMAATSTGQAGAHPNVTASYFLNTINKEAFLEENIISKPYAQSEPPDFPKDVNFDLPPGLVGTTVGMPRCTMRASSTRPNVRAIRWWGRRR